MRHMRYDSLVWRLSRHVLGRSDRRCAAQKSANAERDFTLAIATSLSFLPTLSIAHSLSATKPATSRCDI